MAQALVCEGPIVIALFIVALLLTVCVILLLQLA